MGSSSAMDGEPLDLLCQLENVQGMVDTLTSVRWKRHQVPTFFPIFSFSPTTTLCRLSFILCFQSIQDAVVELSEHGIVLIVEENNCLQAKVYLKSEVDVE